MGNFLMIVFGVVVIIALLVLVDLKNTSTVDRLNTAVAAAKPVSDIGGTSQKWEVVSDLPKWLSEHKSVRIDSVTGMGIGLKGVDSSYFVAYGDEGVGQAREVVKVDDFELWVARNSGKRHIISIASIGEGFEGRALAYLVVMDAQ
jgi:hypothetical protein